MSKNVQATVHLLRLAAEEEIEADRAKARAKALRQGIERLVWQDQATNPNFNLSIKELDLSEGAAALVPKDADTLGKLCQHSVVDLCPPGKEKKYAREIQDLLRPLGLVLKSN